MSTTGCEFYVTVALKEPRYPGMGLKTPKITKGKPSIRRGEIALCFELRVPQSLFREFIPRGVIEIPEDGVVGRPAIEVEIPEDLEVREGVRLKLVPFAEEGQSDV